MKERILVLLRHGDRESRPPDPGLNSRGLAQAEAVVRHFQTVFPGKSARLLCSPRRRCRETLQPLAVALGATIQDDPRLLEEIRSDKSGAFQARIASFTKGWEEDAEGPEITVVCSHGDWIPRAAFLLSGDQIEMDKGAWAQFRHSNGLTELVVLYPSLNQRL